MAGDVHTILCGVCKVPLQGPSDSKDDNVFSCPCCGASDTRKEVLRIVAEHVEEVTARALQESFRKALRGNKFVKATGQTVPKRFHKYVTDFRPKV